MNANEVLANRANELFGAKRGTYAPVHPNDHVNMAQSTNDVIPTAIRLACLAQLAPLVTAFTALRDALDQKGDGVRRRREVGSHAPAGRDADPARPGVSRVRGIDRARPPPRHRSGRLSARSRHRRERGGHGRQRRARVSRADGEAPPRDDRARSSRGQGPHPAHAEHGRCGRLQRAAARPGARRQQDRERPAAHGERSAHRARRDPPPGRAAGLLDHAGEDQSVDPRDGEPGLLPGRSATTPAWRSRPSTASSSST